MSKLFTLGKLEKGNAMAAEIAHADPITTTSGTFRATPTYATEVMNLQHSELGGQQDSLGKQWASG
jgi:hypothetical protein